MTNYNRGDVVLVDLGMTAKIRPCVIVSNFGVDPQRNMSVVVPMTTEIRGGPSEVSFPKPPWLRQASVLNVLGIIGVDNVRMIRRLGAVEPSTLKSISETLVRILSLN